MTLSRLMRRWVSGAVMVTLLFMQLATAAYACPQLARAAGTGTHQAELTKLPDCHAQPAATMDSEQPALCKAHCSKDAQSATAQPTLDLQANPAAMALLQRIVEFAPESALPPAAAATSPWLLPPLGPPPLYLSLLVLRN